MPYKRKARKQINKEHRSLPSIVNTIFDLYEKKAHLLLSTLIAVIGGISITLHFLYNGYFPDLDFTTSLTLLITVAFSTLLMIAGVGFALNINPMIWSLFINTDFGDGAMSGLRQNSQKVTDGKSKTRAASIVILFWFPMVIVTVAAAISLWIFVSKEIVTEANFWIAVAVFYILALLTGYFCYLHLKRKGLKRFGWKDWIIYAGAMLLNFLILVVIPFFVWVLFNSKYSVQTVPQDGFLKLVTVIAGTCLAILSLNAAQCMKAIDDKEKGRSSFTTHAFFSILVLTVVILMSSSYFLFSQAALKVYGLADVENIDILFTEEGCKVLRGFGINYAYNENGKSCLLRHAKLVSAIGTKNLIQAENGRKFAVSKNDSNPDLAKLFLPMKIFVEETRNASGELLKVRISGEGEFRFVQKKNSESTGTFGDLSVFFSAYDRQGNLVPIADPGKIQMPAGIEEAKSGNQKQKTDNLPAKKETGSNSYQLIFKQLASSGEMKINFNFETLPFEVNKLPAWCDVSVKMNANEYSYELIRTVIYEN